MREERLPADEKQLGNSQSQWLRCEITANERLTVLGLCLARDFAIDGELLGGDAEIERQPRYEILSPRSGLARATPPR